MTGDAQYWLGNALMGEGDAAAARAAYQAAIRIDGHVPRNEGSPATHAHPPERHLQAVRRLERRRQRQAACRWS